MPLTFNGNTPSAVTYNGNPVSEVTYNGVTVWQAAPATRATEIGIKVYSWSYDPTFRFTQSAANAITIDWGDGSPTTTSANLMDSITHTYPEPDDEAEYTISITCASGETWYPGNSNIECFNESFYVQSLKLGNGARLDGINAFRYMNELRTVDLYNELTSIAVNTFYGTAFPSIIIPDSVTTINLSVFRANTSLTSVDIGSGVTSIGANSSFRECTALTSYTIRVTTPPANSGLYTDYNPNLVIYVPSGSVADYQQAWSAYASLIQAIP